MKRTFTKITSWTDDRLPCVGFEYRGKAFAVWWTSRQLEGHLDMYDESEKIQKKYRWLLKYLDALIDDPSVDNVEKILKKNDEIGDVDEGRVTDIMCSIGMLNNYVVAELSCPIPVSKVLS